MIGDKGYASIRASHALPDGRSFFEIRVNHGQTRFGQVRIGIASEHADLELPVGVDKMG